MVLKHELLVKIVLLLAFFSLKESTVLHARVEGSGPLSYIDDNMGEFLELPHASEMHEVRQVIPLKSRTCSSRLGEIGHDECLAVRLRMPHLSFESLNTALEVRSSHFFPCVT